MAVSFYLQQINEKIDDIVGQTKRVSNVSANRYVKDKAYCELSDRLDEITAHHSRLIELTIRLNRLCSFQILLSITNFFGILLIEIFLAYLFIAEGLLTGQPIDVPFLMIVLIYALSLFTELLLFAVGCTNVKRISDCIGYSLHREFFSDIDERLKQSMERCSIQLLHYKLNITASDMFCVENNLTFSVS
ncbi:uncharacterized protein LOC119069515 [Bradysia coprophila]|uniref:uncharacterized protein LOC119069515 n=1 Tax=Bradysia coprophila TaxID=38358 RepID=UPI00187D92F4|nr:uncharacterized protein LOC119069515 [Bradysia coprophila]